MFRDPSPQVTLASAVLSSHLLTVYAAFYRNSNGVKEIQTQSSLYSMNSQSFKGYHLHGGSLEIRHTVPLRNF